MINKNNIKKIQFITGAYYIDSVYKEHFLKFMNELILLDIFSWDKIYKDENVLDGGFWSLKIEYVNNEPLEIKGDNAYPNNYGNFIDILYKYFPIIKMDDDYRINILMKNRV